MTKVNAKTVLTRAQRVALFKVFQRDFPSYVTPTRRRSALAVPGEALIRVPSIQWRQFRARVQPAFGDTCVMLKWAGMWLGIERDGYTHS
jgi:hypothetical protein